METTAAQLANLIDGVIEGNTDAAINGAASIDDACHGDVVMADNLRFLEKALESDCSCVIAQRNGKSFSGEINKAIIRVDNPSDAFIKILKLFGGEEYLHSRGIAPTAVLEDGVILGKDVTLGANSFVGRNTVIGDGVILFPNVYIGENVVIGDNTKIYPNVSIYAKCKIGQNVIIHSGAVVGADGFGYKACGVQGLVKYPHIGTVKVGDNVEIGANTTIDRAKTGVTVIGDGTKIDNMVHIAHNVKVGRNCVIVALSGIAGSVEIGDGVTLAAQTGVKDHVKIESGSVVAARAGVISNVASGSIVSGFPARDHSGEKRIEAARLHLPELMQRVKALEKEIERLKENS